MASLSYGQTDAGGFRALRVDNDGKLVVAADLEVALTQAGDSIAVWGNDGSANRALRTDDTGRLQVDAAITSASSLVHVIDAVQMQEQTVTPSASFDVAGGYLQVVVTTNDDCTVFLQASPDNTLFVELPLTMRELVGTDSELWGVQCNFPKARIVVSTVVGKTPTVSAWAASR